VTAKKQMAVILVSGNETFLRTRCVNTIRRSAVRQGAVIRYADGAEPETVYSVLSGPLSFTSDVPRTLLVVKSTGKVPVDALVDHHKDHDVDVTVLVHHLGKSKAKSAFGKLAKALPKDAHQTFAKPSPFKEEELAIEFCVQEARLGYAKRLDPKFARALVVRVGTELGFLSFEVQKAAMLAGLRGYDEIKPEHLGQTMARISEASVWPFLDALGKKSVKPMMQALARVQETSSGDATMKVVGIIRSTVLQWLQVANMHAQHVPPNQAASQLGINPWKYTNILLPAAMRWGENDLMNLVDVLASAESSVRRGSIAPWEFFESRLLGLLAR